MHDPDVLVCDIPAPWLRRGGIDAVLRNGKRIGPDWGLVRHRRTNPEHLGQPVYPWWRPKGYRLFIGGHQYRCRTLAMIWHHDPGGYDAFDECPGDSRWQLHIHHWRITFSAWRAVRRRLLTRCAYCGGRSGRRENAVNTARGWHEQTAKWWQGEKGLYHSECLAAESAWRACVCPDEPPLSSRGIWGYCTRCNGHRLHNPTDLGRDMTRAYRSVPKGKRPTPKVRDAVRAMVATERGVSA